ncbi:MAG TPA: stage III sporulation protein AB [Sphingobacteriaceae bacterium]|nr:stage III sporulation protein AB [Sphingobacteriaceae bacterium]
MMSPSAAGALLVLAGCAALGNQAALWYGRRPRDLAHCQACLQVLLTEIDYGLTPLDEALQRAAAAAPGPAAAVFRMAGEDLARTPGRPPRQAWSQAWRRAAPELALSAADLEILLALGPSLGASDRHHQQRHILLCSRRLAAAETDARAAAQRYLRLYRYLGVIAGGLLAVLLA